MTGWNNNFAKWLEILVILQMIHFAMWKKHAYVFASEFNAQENGELTSNRYSLYLLPSTQNFSDAALAIHLSLDLSCPC